MFFSLLLLFLLLFPPFCCFTFFVLLLRTFLYPLYRLNLRVCMSCADGAQEDRPRPSCESPGPEEGRGHASVSDSLPPLDSPYPQVSRSGTGSKENSLSFGCRHISPEAITVQNKSKGLELFRFDYALTAEKKGDAYVFALRLASCALD